MRTILCLSVLALLASAPAAAQAQAAPRGSYERHCTDIRMQGHFLSATCRGRAGGGQSSINVLSCRGDIGVDAQGGLVCDGPGVAATPAPPTYRDDRGGWRDGRYRDGRYAAVTVYPGPRYRGAARRIDGDMANLADLGLNDQIRSIRLERRSGPWLVCTDAGFRGRCVTIDRSVEDTRRIGMQDAISSLRPAY